MLNEPLPVKTPGRVSQGWESSPVNWRLNVVAGSLVNPCVTTVELPLSAAVPTVVIWSEGIDAEEWGMVDNQTEGGQAAAATGRPSTSATPEERPSTYRKLDFRKGDVVLIATEQPVDSPKQVESPTATEPAATPSPKPTSDQSATPVAP